MADHRRVQSIERHAPLHADARLVEGAFDGADHAVPSFYRIGRGRQANVAAGPCGARRSGIAGAGDIGPAAADLQDHADNPPCGRPAGDREEDLVADFPVRNLPESRRREHDGVGIVGVASQRPWITGNPIIVVCGGTPKIAKLPWPRSG